MNINTKTYNVAQNTSTLKDIREDIPIEPTFNTRTVTTVQQAWDSNTKMRCLNSNKLYIQKSTIGKARVCFVTKDFYLYVQYPPAILNNRGVQIGERRSNLVEQ